MTINKARITIRGTYPFLLRNMILALFLVLLSCSSKEAIFREIELADPYGELALGDDIKDLEEIIAIKDGVIQLREKTFGGAKAIELKSSETGQIQAMILKYKNKADFDAAVKSYTKRLGEPQFSGNKYIWEDKKTHFEVGFTKDGECFYSKLSDLSK